MLAIGEFSKISRVSPKTLRYYDQIGLLKPNYVSCESGYRYYDAAQLRDMLLIQRLKQYQFSLPEIAAVLAKKDDGFLSGLIREKKCALADQIALQQSVLLRMELDLQKIERCENIMQTEYVIKTASFQPVSVYSLRQKMSFNEFDGLFDRLYAGLQKNHLTPAGPCFSIYHDEECNRDCMDVEIGVIVAETDGPNIRRLDPGFCCFAAHIGPYDDFTACYTALAEWIEREGFAIAGPPVELYVKGCQNSVSPSEYVTEIYFPISK